MTIRNPLKLAAVFFAAAAAGLSAAPAHAHPHVWVVVKAVIEFDGAGQMTGVRHVWTFDEAFSAYASTGLDSNKDGAFTREELAPLAKVNIESLNEFKYFTFFLRGKEEFGFDEPKDYFLEHDGKALKLNFTLPVKQALRPKTGDRLEIYDPTYFVSYELAEKDAVAARGETKGCVVAAEAPKANSSRLLQLSESFFESMAGGANIGADFANRVRFTCP